MEENSLVVGAQTEYDRDVMGEGIDRMRKAGIDPHGDGCGEPAGPDTISADQWYHDCPDFCIGGNKEHTDELMKLCRDALRSLDMLEGSKGTTALRFGQSVTFYSQLIGEYVVKQLLANNITADMLEVDNG